MLLFSKFMLPPTLHPPKKRRKKGRKKGREDTVLSVVENKKCKGTRLTDSPYSQKT